MNLRELEAFLKLSQTLHFAKTAEALHISASTLSRMMQRLEDEFGQQLLVRDNRSVELTPRGERFVVFARDVMLRWHELKRDFKGDATKVTGTLTLYCTVTAAHLYLSKLLSEFRKRYPDVEIKLETGDVSHAFEVIEQKKADIAFAVAPEQLATRYYFKTIDIIPLKVIAPIDSGQLTGKLNVEKPDWREIPFVLPESGPSKVHTWAWLKRMRIKPSVYAHVSGHEAIVSMTALGCGVSVVPLPVLENSPVKEKVQVLTVPLLPKPFELGVTCLKNRVKEPVVQAFNKLVLELF